MLSFKKISIVFAIYPAVALAQNETQQSSHEKVNENAAVSTYITPDGETKTVKTEELEQDSSFGRSSDMNVDHKNARYKVCQMLCRNEGSSWESVDELCEAIPSQHCELVPADLAPPELGLGGKLQGFLCKFEEQGSGNYEMKETFSKVEFSHESSEAKEIKDYEAQAQARKNNDLVTLTYNDIQTMYDRPEGHPSLDPARFHQFCYKHCHLFPNFPEYVDPLENQREREEYTQNHSVAMRDVFNDVALKKEEFCPDPIRKFVIDNMFFNPSTTMLMMIR